MVLDQAVRLLQAMVDIAADAGFLRSTLFLMTIAQMIIQGRWHTESTLLSLPHITSTHLPELRRQGIACLPHLFKFKRPRLEAIFKKLGLPQQQCTKVVNTVQNLPQVEVKWALESKTIEAEESGVVNITLARINKGSIGVYAPRFPKHVEEGWWLVLGDEATGELYGLKRIRFSGRLNTKLTFQAPEDVGQMELTLYLMCDSYLGLDQQYSFEVDVV